MNPELYDLLTDIRQVLYNAAQYQEEVGYGGLPVVRPQVGKRWVDEILRRLDDALSEEYHPTDQEIKCGDCAYAHHVTMRHGGTVGCVNREALIAALTAIEKVGRTHTDKAAKALFEGHNVASDHHAALSLGYLGACKHIRRSFGLLDTSIEEV